MARPRKALGELQIHRHISIPPKYVSVYNELADKHKSAGVAWTKLVDYYLTNEEGALKTYPLALEVINKINEISCQKLGSDNEIQQLIPILNRVLTRVGYDEELKRRSDAKIAILRSNPE